MSKEETEAQIIDLDAVRKAKQQDSPLNEELAERIARIKQSIERINKLMAELKSQASPVTTTYDKWKPTKKE
jgi:uncharacterized coiled-coil protein SlyX